MDDITHELRMYCDSDFPQMGDDEFADIWDELNTPPIDAMPTLDDFDLPPLDEELPF